ncbi:MBL fold metallo-hydrolase [Halorubrum distributum]|uniref:MBL fold metallo-hydrolase n=1 Tax=Halorubrum distributum TaxID=29283 RepID=UPI0029552238|nr:MBL fold metallo-hydrolase [Halorubrum distributum]MDV7348624.1 MBL fold metallo-hydrolase [Halorubrum distributum]
MTVRYEEFSVEWLGYATARLETDAGPVAYTDPGRYGVLDDYWARDGDLVVVTHDHHYDSDGIRSVASEDATLVIYEAVDPAGIDRDVEPIDALAADYDVVRVGEEERVDVETPAGEVRVWSVPAHNDPEGPNADADGSVAHPPGFGCGFLLSLGGRTVFWPGDADALDGFAELDVSVFLANIGGGGIVADRREAADLAEAMAPDLVVPIHYDTFDLLEADGEAFAGDVASRSIPVALDARSANQ